MQLENIAIGKLSVSALNMRHGKKAPDVSDILPSIRARGILTPLLVRPTAADPDRFEIVAGRRRYHAALAVIEEGVEIEPVPCAIIAAGDDAAALEASLIENSARLDPDEVTNWQTFTRLIQKEGRSIADISQTFGITELRVKRILALGNLAPRIRALYGQEAIDVATVRHLTLASKVQQRGWLALYDDPQAHAPTGQRLKGWLFGGESISTKVALFAVEDYKGAIVADLFGEDAYFEDPDLFWTMQNEAIASQAEALKGGGWSDVEILETGDHFHSWEYEKTPKAKGGKVFIAVRHNGEVVVNEGWLSGKEAKRARSQAAKAEASEADRDAAKASRAEVTSSQQTYIDLHRHAAVRAVLTDHPSVALRLMVAHAITGSALWSVKIEKQNARNDAVAQSVETSIGESRFDESAGLCWHCLACRRRKRPLSGATATTRERRRSSRGCSLCPMPTYCPLSPSSWARRWRQVARWSKRSAPISRSRWRACGHPTIYSSI